MKPRKPMRKRATFLAALTLKQKIRLSTYFKKVSYNVLPYDQTINSQYARENFLLGTSVILCHCVYNGWGHQCQSRTWYRPHLKKREFKKLKHQTRKSYQRYEKVELGDGSSQGEGDHHHEIPKCIDIGGWMYWHEDLLWKASRIKCYLPIQ